MRRAAWIAAGVLTHAAAADLATLDAYANHNAFVDGPRASVLRLVFGADLRLERASAAPLASLALLYDGERGRLESREDTFLEFDGRRAVLGWSFADWRRPESIAFTALEPRGTPAAARLRFAASGGAARALRLARRLIDERGEWSLVEYAARALPALGGGTLVIDYTAPGSSHARLGEIVVDGIGAAPLIATSKTALRTFEDWMQRFGAAECPRVREAVARMADPASGEFVRLALRPPHGSVATKLVYWRQFRDAGMDATIHSIVLKVDDTGDVSMDLVRAWIVIPRAARARVPLVVLPHQGHIYAAQEPLGILGEIELGMARELARHGIASVAYDSALYGTPGAAFVTTLFHYYPLSGTTAKDLDNLRRLMTYVLDPAFRTRGGVGFDRSRIGIWGFSYGAWIAMLAGATDERIRAVAFSSFHYHDRDIAPGLSASLYIPQLGCLEAGAKPPISVARMLRGYGRDVFAVVPDAGLLREWTQGLDDPRVVVAANPFGHLVTEQERAAVLDFFYRVFGIAASARPRGVAHDLPHDAAPLMPYVERENRWREALIRALGAK